MVGIPTSAFQAGDLYIEYGFEEVLFRYEKKTARFFCKFYDKTLEYEVPHDSKLLCDAQCSGVLTTAERYISGGAPVADPAADSSSRMAVKYQRIRPYWLSVMHLKNYTRSGAIEVGAEGRLEVIKAADSIKELLEKVVSDINSRPCLSVTYGDEALITVDKKSKGYEFGLRLELKKRELTVISESSYYEGRSGP
jgi:hypothetical protein